jgi:vanillate/3-O-methylgallate O-demethylase
LFADGGVVGTARDLEEILPTVVNAARMLRNCSWADVYAVVAAEFSNRRSEQWASQHSAVLFDQPRHLANL